ncbi:MAG: hypothetical protein AAFX45_11130 [Pseudomonadota bacterium]
MSSVIHAIVYCTVALFALTSLGNIAHRALSRLIGQPATPPAEPGDSATTPPDPRNGRVIGTLERLVLAAALVFQSWPLVAAVIALKSVARFKALEQKVFAEYFLIGSFFSLLWALLITGAWLAYDARWGLDLQGQLTALFAP